MEPDEIFKPSNKKLARGRGATLNPANRFDLISVERDPESEEPLEQTIPTQYYDDTTKSILSTSDSPDLGRMTNVNAYRGCEHGCIYCYARPGHEYFGLSSGLDFETKIFVKRRAAELLRKELSKPTWKPRVVTMSGVTDCYQPAEKHFKITRGCLEVLRDFRNPVVIITKNHLVTRDMDLLKELSEYQACFVIVSVTTLDRQLARKMEPRASSPTDRLKAIATLHATGIPVGVNVAPIIPGLTDHEIPAILKAAAKAGAQSASYTIVRLPYAVKDLFAAWLQEHFPLKKEKVLNRLRAMRGGKLYDAKWSARMTGEGVHAQQIASFFDVAYKKAGFPSEGRQSLSAKHFRPPPSDQLTFF
jgi:DNA repair photolyase